MDALAYIVRKNAKPTINRGARGYEPTKGLKMRSLPEIVKANREAEALGVYVDGHPGFAPVGTKPDAKHPDVLSTERMQQLGLVQY